MQLSVWKNHHTPSRIGELLLAIAPDRHPQAKYLPVDGLG